jgi:hypothetical protein
MYEHKRSGRLERPNHEKDMPIFNLKEINNGLISTPIEYCSTLTSKEFL